MERIPESESISDMTVACRFDEFMRGHRFRQQDYRRLARIVVERGVPAGGTVLDIGTGPGFLGIEVARRLRGTGCRVVGLDLSGAMLNLAVGNAHRRSLGGQLLWLQADAKAMPFGDGEFDVVSSSDSLHHWKDPLPVLNEIARVLKDGGKYLIHDLRRPQCGRARLASWLIGMTVPLDVRSHYRTSIQAAYTPSELRRILSRSMLPDWQVHQGLLDLTILN
jgi:ubiquinone/menaquinone biosynthesis C-methylase UbiE